MNMNFFKSALGNVNDLEKQRATITTLRAELEDAKATPLDLASATKRFDDWLDSRHDGADMAQFLDADNKAPQPGIYPDGVDSMTLILQLVGKAAVRNHLHGQLTTEAKGRKGMSAEQRRAKMASIEARLLEAEVLLEGLICGFEGNGFPIQRDANADVRAVLGLV
jgi:hypothetical protein